MLAINRSRVPPDQSLDPSHLKSNPCTTGEKGVRPFLSRTGSTAVHLSSTSWNEQSLLATRGNDATVRT
jgi:hypothetical protein